MAEIKNRNVRSLRIRPHRSADLSFNMAGIIERQSMVATLGKTAEAFDAREFSERFPKTDPNDKALLKYDSANIWDELKVTSRHLFVLRNAPLEAAVDQAIQRRAAAYRERFQHSDDIAKHNREYLKQLVSHLYALKKNAEDRQIAFDKAINDDPSLNQVRKETRATSEGVKIQSTTTTDAALIGTQNELIGAGQPLGAPGIWTSVYDTKKDGAEIGKVVQVHSSGQTLSKPVRKATGGWQEPDLINGMYPTQKAVTTTNDEAREQVTRTEVVQLLHPQFDSTITHLQLLARLDEETLKSLLAELAAQDAGKVLAHELRAVDLEIRALQLNLLHTYLFTPFKGKVTAVYKDIGESVEPGEPVIRIEDGSRVLLVGRVRHRKAIRIGQNVNVMSNSLFESGVPWNRDGEVVSVRGHEVDDDEWEVFIDMDNPNDDLPINGAFDPDSTEIDFR